MTIISKTANQYIKEVKQEFINNDPKLWSDSLIPSLKQEYYDMTMNCLHTGNKITQEVYDEMVQDESHMFEYFLNKQFLIHGINIITK